MVNFVRSAPIPGPLQAEIHDGKLYPLGRTYNTFNWKESAIAHGANRELPDDPGIRLIQSRNWLDRLIHWLFGKSLMYKNHEIDREQAVLWLKNVVKKDIQLSFCTSNASIRKELDDVVREIQGRILAMYGEWQVRM